jgi:hypothetical protein
MSFEQPRAHRRLDRSGRLTEEETMSVVVNTRGIHVDEIVARYARRVVAFTLWHQAEQPERTEVVLESLPGADEDRVLSEIRIDLPCRSEIRAWGSGEHVHEAVTVAANRLEIALVERRLPPGGSDLTLGS